MGHRTLHLLLSVAARIGAATLARPARAADHGVAQGVVETEGVPCEAPIVQGFPSVWLGHFSGGYSHYLGPGESIVLDWRDEKLCFPSRGSCNRYISAMRRGFHRPEGYFTCLPIR
jgi:hypothetical protein